MTVGLGVTLNALGSCFILQEFEVDLPRLLHLRSNLAKEFILVAVCGVESVDGTSFSLGKKRNPSARSVQRCPTANTKGLAGVVALQSLASNLVPPTCCALITLSGSVRLRIVDAAGG